MGLRTTSIFLGKEKLSATWKTLTPEHHPFQENILSIHTLNLSIVNCPLPCVMWGCGWVISLNSRNRAKFCTKGIGLSDLTTIIAYLSRNRAKLLRSMQCCRNYRTICPGWKVRQRTSAWYKLYVEATSGNVILPDNPVSRTSGRHRLCVYR
jgi:hypothetical protein